MTDEAALKLAAAMERLAAAIEQASGMHTLGGVIHIYHHDAPMGPYTPQQPYQPFYIGPNWVRTGSVSGANMRYLDHGH